MPKIPAPIPVNKNPLPVRPPAPPPGAVKIALKHQAALQPPTGKSADKPGTQTPTTNFTQQGAGVYPIGTPVNPAFVGALSVNSAAADPQISMEVNSLSSSLEDLKSRSTLGRIADEVNRLDTDLTHVLNLLESARQESYVYQKDIDETAYRTMDQWTGIKGN